MASRPEPQARTSARPASGGARGGGKSIPEVATELWGLATEYAKQETIYPLKSLGRFIGYGIGGGIALGIGVVLMLLALLRALQTETSTAFTGSWSWAPYVITVAVGTLLIVLALARINRRKGPGA